MASTRRDGCVCSSVTGAVCDSLACFCSTCIGVCGVDAACRDNPSENTFGRVRCGIGKYDITNEWRLRSFNVCTSDCIVSIVVNCGGVVAVMSTDAIGEATWVTCICVSFAVASDGNRQAGQASRHRQRIASDAATPHQAYPCRIAVLPKQSCSLTELQSYPSRAAVSSHGTIHCCGSSFAVR